MNITNMAGFISESRKSKNLTQKQLAEKLNITDKAVSKWERGLGYPDITTLSALAEILGVTTNELLNGQREEHPMPQADAIVQNTLEYAEVVTINTHNNARKIAKLIITGSSILAIVICIICDLALSNGLTWSLYPISSIVFAWLVIIPLFHFNKNNIIIALSSLCVFIIPFLFVIEHLTDGDKWLIPLGIPLSIATIIYFWLVCYLFTKTNLNKWYASGIAFILAIPLSLIINYTVFKFSNKILYFDVWDALSIGLLVVVSIVLFSIGFVSKNNQISRLP